MEQYASNILLAMQFHVGKGNDIVHGKEKKKLKREKIKLKDLSRKYKQGMMDHTSTLELDSAKKRDCTIILGEYMEINAKREVKKHYSKIILLNSAEEANCDWPRLVP